MKEISISLWELTSDEAQTMPEDKDILVYNSFFNEYSLVRGGPACKKKLKVVSSLIKPCLHFFSFEE